MPRNPLKRSSSNQADQTLEQVLNRIDSEPVRCLDVETSGLDFRRCAIVGYVLAFGPNPPDSYYVPVRHAGTANVAGREGLKEPHGWDGEILPWEKELVRKLDMQGTTIFGHNIAFDLKFMWRVGMTDLLPRFEDTIINAPLLDEFQPFFNLEYCAATEKVEAKKSQMIVDYLCGKFEEARKGPKEAMGHYWRLSGDDPVAVEYATGDGVTTWQLRDKQMVRIRAEELTKVHDIESRLIPVLIRMSMKGIKIDLERLEWVGHHIDTEVERLSNEFPSGFNSRSPVNVRNWMEDHGHTDWPMTTGGTKPMADGSKRKPQPSMKEDWLKKYPAGRMVVKIRKFATLRSTFVDPLKNEHVWNGRVHTTFNQLRSDEFGTVTGRLSSSNPNTQAIPKHNVEIGRLFRSVFVPDDGLIWASRDYSQIEPRILAFYSRCKVLIDGYLANPPVDAHMSASIAACGPRWADMSPVERKAYRDDYGKRVNQTVITGGGKGVLVSKYGIPADEVDKVWDDYFRAMPEIKKLQKEAGRTMLSRGYVRSLLGRKARLQDSSKSYTAVNRLLQCGNADALKLKMVEIDDYLKSEGRPLDLINNVHDALDFQFGEGARKHFEECERIATNFDPGQVIELDIPIAMDGDEGPNWAIATYGEEK